MRKLFVLLTVAVLSLGLAGTASAALLNWSGTGMVLLADFPPGILTGGGVATINDSAGGIPGHVEKLRLKASRGGVGGTIFLLVTDPDTAGNSIAAISYQLAGGTGTLSPISGAMMNSSLGLVRNRLPIRGIVRLCLLSTSCTSFLEVILTEQQTLNGVVTSTVGAGLGGQLTIGGDSPIRISIEAAPWTIKTRTVIDHITTTNKVNQVFEAKMFNGFAHGPSSGTTDTAQPSGVIQLVAPNQVRTNLPFGSNKKSASGTTLIIHFIPEPGLLLLLGSGVAGLALIGRRRLRDKPRDTDS